MQVSKREESIVQPFNENNEEINPADEKTGGAFRKRLLSVHKFFKYFYVEHKHSQWQSLIGPGHDSETNDSSVTHLWYIFILSFIPVCSFLAASGLIQPYLASDGLEWGCGKETCEVLIVLFVTYRIGFAVALFFLFTTLILVTSSKENASRFSSTLHSGFWVEKIIVVLLLSCVAFSFPPRVFDEIWHYFVLAGDVIVSCLQMFLICDVVKLLEARTRTYIIKNKRNTVRICAMIFIQIAIPLTFIFIFYTLSAYHLSNVDKGCAISTGIMVTNLMFILLVLLYIIIFRHRHILCTLYVVSFDLFLVLKASTYAKNYCQPEKHKGSLASSISLNSVIATFLLYLTFIYALVRRYRPSDFFYFYWIICRENDLVIATGHKNPNSEKQREPVRPKEKNVNANETLLEFSFESSSEGSEEKVKTEKNANDPRKKRPADHYCIRYSESFIHAVFFFVSLKSTVTVTDYQILGEKFYSRTLVQPLVSLVTLHVTSTVVLLLYAWYVQVFYTSDSNVNPHSVGTVLKKFVQGAIEFVYHACVKIPNCVGIAAGVRYFYLLLYTLGFIFSCVLLMPFFQNLLHNKALYCEHNLSFMKCMFQHPTFIGLYRTLATMATFFLLMCLLLINVNTRNSRRDVIQNGCWISKFILIALLYLFYTKLPGKTSKIWVYVGLLSTFWFTVVQLFCLIDAMAIVHASWNQTRSSKSIVVSSTSYASFLYFLSAAAFTCFYIYFTQNSSCKVNRMFISINLVLCFASTIISIHPIVRSGGLLRSAVVTSFCMYLTWSALNYDPNEKCNPMAESWILLEFDGSGNVAPIIDIFCLTVCLFYFTFRINNIISNLKQLLPYFLLRYKSSCSKHNESMHFHESYADAIKEMNENYEKQPQDSRFIEKWLSDCKHITHAHPDAPSETSLKERLLFGYDNNQEYSCCMSRTFSSMLLDTEHAVPYCYSCLHFVFFMATSYLLILLTHWIEPLPGSDFRISLQWALMSVKMFASSTCVLSYIWLLIEPVIENLYK